MNVSIRANCRFIYNLVISLIYVMLFSSNKSFAESSRDYHVSLGANYNNYEVLNVGIFDQRFAGLNDHLDLTLIHSPTLDYVPGIDIGVGWAFFRVGGVVGGCRDRDKNNIGAMGAIYPEIYMPLFPLYPIAKKHFKHVDWDRYIPYISTRYYITTKGSDFFTLGIGVVWDPPP
ncbi:MAG TPA: hypothetical protein VI298_13825 [Geobacteraceae bacterium]